MLGIWICSSTLLKIIEISTSLGRFLVNKKTAMIVFWCVFQNKKNVSTFYKKAKIKNKSNYNISLELHDIHSGVSMEYNTYKSN